LLYLLMLKQVHSDVLDDGNEHSMYKPCTTAYNLEIFTFFSGFSDQFADYFFLQWSLIDVTQPRLISQFNGFFRAIIGANVPRLSFFFQFRAQNRDSLQIDLNSFICALVRESASGNVKRSCTFYENLDEFNLG